MIEQLLRLTLLHLVPQTGELNPVRRRFVNFSVEISHLVLATLRASFIVINDSILMLSSCSSNYVTRLVYIGQESS